MRIKKSNLRKLIKEVTAGKNASAKTVRFKGSAPTVFIDGERSDIAQCPSEVKRVAKLFDSLDPSRETMHSFGVRGYKTSAGMEWKVTLFGERYVNVRHRGSVSGGGYSAGGDYRNVDFEPDTDSEDRARVGIWATIQDGIIDIEAFSGIPGYGFGNRRENTVLSSGRRVKASAVKDWAESNVSFSGYYKGTSWQEDPFDSPGHRGGSVTIGASY
tara:strand:+ start:1410 stop:2054 length:645 start_codon:yes stop_codon:yes gene_type:complete